MNDCSLCNRLKLLNVGKDTALIREFPHSWFILGDHQYFFGYSVLISKRHAKEMTDLTSQESQAVFAELLLAQRAIEQTFSPWKMNVCSLGNVVPHVHWHLFPRYANDAHKLSHPWINMHQFEEHKPTAQEAQLTIEKIQQTLRTLCE